MIAMICEYDIIREGFLGPHGSYDRSIIVVFVVIVTMLMEMKKLCRSKKN